MVCKMQPLAKPAIEVVKNNKTRFVQKRFEKIYFNWMENIKDWCISANCGGVIGPAYYCEDCRELVVAKDPPEICNCGGKKFRQDEDVLDTGSAQHYGPFLP